MELSDDALRELAALSGIALEHEELKTALEGICRIAVRAVPGADGASLTTISVKGPDAVASSDPWAADLDEMQYDEHEGPCLDAARSGVAFRVPDTAVEPRWPAYMPRAVGMGALSMMSLPLTNESKTVGALNVYSRQPETFDAKAVSLGELIAGHASLASQVAATLFRHRDLADQLRIAMASRSTIDQAKGIIMVTSNCDADTAFALLVEQSQHENRKLREVAEELVARHGRSNP